MKRIYYASGSVVTGDRTARAVLSYAQALSETESSATIDIPILAHDGTTVRAQLLIGPASQILAVPEQPTHDVHDLAGLDDESVLQVLELKVEGLLSPKAQPVPYEDVAEHSDLH